MSAYSTMIMDTIRAYYSIQRWMGLSVDAQAAEHFMYQGWMIAGKLHIRQARANQPRCHIVGCFGKGNAYAAWRLPSRGPAGTPGLRPSAEIADARVNSPGGGPLWSRRQPQARRQPPAWIDGQDATPHLADKKVLT